MFAVTERLTHLGFQAVTMTLQCQAGQNADYANGETGQAQTKGPRNDQQKANDKQRHGDQVQGQVRWVLVLLRVAMPLPGGEIGMTFAHDGDSSVR